MGLGINSAPSAGDLLLCLLQRFRLSRREQVIVVMVLTAAGPLTVKELARRRRRLAYSHAKAVVRTLVAWRILTRTPTGLLFQPDPALWGPPRGPTQL